MKDSKIVIANWKLNPETPREAKNLFNKIKKQASRLDKIEIIVAPPAIFLSLLETGRSKKIFLAGQNVFWEKAGAFTGQTSPSSLNYLGIDYVIIGHSEVRALGDDNEKINKKIKLALKCGLKVIFCVGESNRDRHGHYLKFIKEQVTSGLKQIEKKYFKNLIIAYEPVWAIGRIAQAADTPADFLHNALFIKKILASLVDKKIAFSIPILYGGSVNQKNVTGFLVEGEAGGVLVGRSSLEADHFNQILKIASHV